MALQYEEVLPMKRITVLLLLCMLVLPASRNTLWAAQEATPQTLKKECVLFGRILGSHLMLYPSVAVSEPVYDPGPELPAMVQIKSFEVLNTVTGEWQPLILSPQGYFCTDLGKGMYDLRGRTSDGRPYLIQSFSVPAGMAVNLGTFWVEACDPRVISREGWHSYMNEAGWREYRMGSHTISLRLEHVTTDGAYQDCEEWFASCHEEVYERFAAVIARR